MYASPYLSEMAILPVLFNIPPQALAYHRVLAFTSSCTIILSIYKKLPTTFIICEE